MRHERGLGRPQWRFKWRHPRDMREEKKGDEMKKPKKILNDPRRATEEMMQGLVLAYDGRVGRVEGHGALYLKDMPQEKVALLVGGGSGHEPIFGGFIGRNLADGAAWAWSSSMATTPATT
jgi:dihydroxyacetone kinase-like protein